MQAERVKCASLMRQVGLAARQYTIDIKDNKGNLSQFRNFDDRNGDGSGPRLGDSEFNYLYTLGDTGAPDMGSGIGRMIATGYFGKVNPTASDWGTNFARLQGKYGMCPAADDIMISQGAAYKASYYFQPHIAVRTFNGTGHNTRWWPKLTPYGKPPKTLLNASLNGATATPHAFTVPMALMSDPIYDIGYATHFAGKSKSWNLLYSDGSVRIAVVDSRVSRAGGHWGQMLDMLGYLEAIADQGEVQAPNVWNKYNWVPVDP